MSAVRSPDRSTLRFIRYHIAAAAIVVAGLATPAAADRESPEDVAFNKACALPTGGKVVIGWGLYPKQDYRRDPVWTRKLPRKTHALHRVSVLRNKGLVRLAKLTTISPSGDWTQVTRYCYRADGTLAHIASTLRTTYGKVRVFDLLTYDGKGKLIRRNRKIYDLKTGWLLRKNARGFHAPELKVFRTSLAFRRHVSPVLN